MKFVIYVYHGKWEKKEKSEKKTVGGWLIPKIIIIIIKRIHIPAVFTSQVLP